VEKVDELQVEAARVTVVLLIGIFPRLGAVSITTKRSDKISNNSSDKRPAINALVH
jgi:hypothetical protein